MDYIDRLEIDDSKAPIYYYYYYFKENTLKQEKIKAFDEILTKINFLEAILKTNYIYVVVDKTK